MHIQPPKNIYYIIGANTLMTDRQPCQRHSAPCWPAVLYFGWLPSLRLQEEARSVFAQEGTQNHSSTSVNCIYVRGCQ